LLYAPIAIIDAIDDYFHYWYYYLLII
jgi:hypothetical protein